jgi:spore coat polysaccharide biosynthesis protein SpsF (cytidylyltransferase family)/predicted dehydrogenase
VNEKPLKIGAVIVARMRSSRFPGKALIDIMGRPSLLHLITRVRQVSEIQDIVIATTKQREDDAIVKLAAMQKLACFRGSEDDVMSRVLKAAQSRDLDVVVHLTGDCPLMEPDLILQVLNLFQNENADYAKNFQFGPDADPKKSFPRGLEIEVFKTEALAKVEQKTNDPWHREHVTEPLYTWPEFKAVTLPAPASLNRPDMRLCIDTPEDHKLITTVLNAMKVKPHFGLQDIVDFLDVNPQICELNASVKQTKYTAAIIGLGKIGTEYDEILKLPTIQTHAGAYLRWSKTRLLAGCDSDATKRKNFQKTRGIETVFSNAEALLKEAKPDIVSICTPPKTHLNLLRLCLDSGVKGILCEKPFLLEIKAAKEILTEIDAKDIPVAVNHWMRYSPVFQQIKALLDQGAIGTLQSASYHYCKGVWNSGTHAVDLLRYFFGEVISVHATASHPIDTGEVNIDGELEFTSGLPAKLTTSDYKKKLLSELVITGSAGEIRATDTDHFVVTLKGASGSIVPHNWPRDKGEFMVAIVANLVDAIEKRAHILCSARDGLAAVIAVKKLEESAENGFKKITL